MPRLGVGNWKGPLNKFRTFCPLICGGKWRGMPRLTWVNPAAPLMPNFLAPMSASIANKTCSHFHALLCPAAQPPALLLLYWPRLQNWGSGQNTEAKQQNWDDSNNWVTKFWLLFEDHTVIFWQTFQNSCLESDDGNRLFFCFERKYSGCHWKIYKCCLMKLNCHFQRGVL